MTPHTPLSGHLFKSYANFLINSFFGDTLYKLKLYLSLLKKTGFKIFSENQNNIKSFEIADADKTDKSQRVFLKSKTSYRNQSF